MTGKLDSERVYKKIDFKKPARTRFKKIFPEIAGF